jgi:hypothetical protein
MIRRFFVLCTVFFLCCGLLVSSIFLVPPVQAAGAEVTIYNEIAGRTPLHIGYNMGHYMPDSNTSSWVDYSGVNMYRIWAAMDYYEPTDDLAPYGDGVTDLSSFELRKADLRTDPENTSYINWPVFNDLFENYTQEGRNKVRLNYQLGELKQLGVETMAVLNPTPWGDSGTWEDRWELWQYEYTAAYHMAKNYDVRFYEIFNEPDHPDNMWMNQDTYIDILKFSSDAIRSAIADVNSRYGKSLTAQISAPVLTHAQSSSGDYHMVADPDSDSRDDTYGWGQKAMMNIRTDYKGNTVNYDIFNIFGTHKYNKIGSDFYNEIGMIDTRMQEFSPTKTALPIYYTEFNRYSTGEFTANPSYNLSNMDTVTDIAGIYAKSMLKGVDGMIAFKFSNTYSDAHGYQGTGFHYVWNEEPYHIGGVTRSGEVVRFLSKGFKGGRDRYKTLSNSAYSDYGAYTAFDPVTNNYYILAINPNTSNDYSVTFNMSGLGVYTDSVITVEEISEDHWGEATQVTKMPSTKSFALTQPKESVWLITVPKGPVLNESKLTAAEDAQVQGGFYANSNFGSDTAMRIKRDSLSTSNNRASYLKFNTSGIDLTKVKRAILRVYGRNPIDSVDFDMHAYGISNDDWSESSITWNNAPNLDPNSSRMTGVGTGAFPVGHLSVDGTNQIVRMDVTDYVKKHPDSILSFTLIREERYDGDDGHDGRHAYLYTSEASSGRPYLELWYGN